MLAKHLILYRVNAPELADIQKLTDNKTEQLPISKKKKKATTIGGGVAIKHGMR